MSCTLSLSTLTNVLSLSWKPLDTREWAFPHKIGLRIGMHSCSVTCDLETNRQQTCSCEYHVPPREGEGNTFAASLMMYLAPRTAEHGSFKLYPHSVTCFLIPKYQLNPEITPCPWSQGSWERSLQQHIVYTAQEASASSRPSQPFPNVYST